jgi:hypothetical protein
MCRQSALPRPGGGGGAVPGAKRWNGSNDLGTAGGGYHFVRLFTPGGCQVGYMDIYWASSIEPCFNCKVTC